MYRIELSPGEETAFRSIEELAVAIRRGVVTSKARIWHNTTGKWLPIQYHPHYKTAATMPLTQADLVVGPPVAPLSSLSLPDPTSTESRVTPFRPVDPTPGPEAISTPTRVTPSKPASPYHQVEPQGPATPTSGLPLIEPLGGSMSSPSPVRPEPAAPLPPRQAPVKPQPAMRTVQAEQPVRRVEQPARRVEQPARRVEQPARKKKSTRSRKGSKRALRVAFIGALLIGGAHVLMSASGAFSVDGLRTHRRLIATSPEAVNRDSPRTVAAVIPVLRNSSIPGGAAKLHTEGRTRKPGPTIGVAPAVASAVSATDSGPEIQAAPAVEITSAPKATDSLSPAVVDSSGRKVLKGILRTVSGAPGSEKKPSKR